MTGYDKVDISRGLLPLAVEHRVKGQIEFIRGNLYVPQHSLSHSHLHSFMCTIQPETTPLQLQHLRPNKNVMPHTLRTHRRGTRIRRSLSHTRPRWTTGVDRRYHHLPGPTPPPPRLSTLNSSSNRCSPRHTASPSIPRRPSRK